MGVIFVSSYDFWFLFCFHRLEYLFGDQSVWRGDKIMRYWEWWLSILLLFLSEGDRDHGLGLSFCYANKDGKDSDKCFPL